MAPFIKGPRSVASFSLAEVTSIHVRRQSLGIHISFDKMPLEPSKMVKQVEVPADNLNLIL